MSKITDLQDAVEELTQRLHDLEELHPEGDRCPHCGYCPACGRTNYPKLIVGDAPIWPQPWHPTIVGRPVPYYGTMTVSGNAAAYRDGTLVHHTEGDQCDGPLQGQTEDDQ